jgi:hypothetical protein
MTIKTAFIRILCLQCLPVTAVALLVGIPYLLLAPGFLAFRNPWLNLLILVHCVALALRLGHMSRPSTEFMYTQGYSRDLIWLHIIISTLLSVLAVWLPLALCLWWPLRSGIQDHVLASPYYPLMRIRDSSLPWFWLYGYGLLLPLFHYVWIRRAQPGKGSEGAVLIAIGVVMAAYVMLIFPEHPDWFMTVAWMLSVVVALTTLVAGRLLHRSMEID